MTTRQGRARAIRIGAVPVPVSPLDKDENFKHFVAARTARTRYEYPHVVRFLDELPRTLTGKVQRFRLREWAQQASRVGPELAAVEPDPELSVGP